MGKKGSGGKRTIVRYKPRVAVRKTPKRSILVALLGIGVISIPLTSSYGTQSGNPLSQFQAGNWAAALYGLQQNLVNGWSALVFPLVLLFIAAWGLKKYGGRIGLTRHHTI